MKAASGLNKVRRALGGVRGGHDAGFSQPAVIKPHAKRWRVEGFWRTVTDTRTFDATADTTVELRLSTRSCALRLARASAGTELRSEARRSEAI